MAESLACSKVPYSSSKLFTFSSASLMASSDTQHHHPANHQPGANPESSGTNKDDAPPMTLLNDKPIEYPIHDKFGFDSFAKALAKSIINNKNPEGTVIAIHGSWGSGKSSIINLVKSHLKKAPKSDQLQITDFKCWWFKGQEALTLEFFRKMYAELDKSDESEIKKAIGDFGSVILISSALLVSASINSLSRGIAEEALSKFYENLIKQKQSAQSNYDKISKQLKNSKKRYVMIIDDIDRLSPDEALSIFRLIKSVGQLPKVTYLLAYDRKVAEKIVSERYPSEGPHYLEKIVQAGFDIPVPLRPKINDIFISFLSEEIWGKLKQSEYWKKLEELDDRYKEEKFLDIFNNVIAPQIQSPRDIIRIMNALKVTWSMVAEEIIPEVDPLDFLIFETIRVKQPNLYSTLIANKQCLTSSIYCTENKATIASIYENLFLSEFKNEKRAEIKKILSTLFPLLDAVWEGKDYESCDQEWDRQRRACSHKHFDTYFRFSLSKGIVSITFIHEIIDNSRDENHVKCKLLECENLINLLEQLKVHVKHIPIENAEAFLSALYTVHDEKEKDQQGELLRMDSLLLEILENLLLKRRISLQKRSKIIHSAIKNKSLGIIAVLISNEYHNYHLSQEDKFSKSEDKRLMTESDMKNLHEIITGHVEKATKQDNLLNNKELGVILFAKYSLASPKEREDTKSSCTAKLAEDYAVNMFVKAFLSEKKLFSADAALSNEDYTIQKNNIGKFIDTEKLKQRVDEMLLSQLKDKNLSTLEKFKDTYKMIWDGDSLKTGKT